jgi:uncharacterized protein
MNDSSGQLETIKSLSKELIPGCEVILFGSRAREEYGIDSDYDILIVIPSKIDIRDKLVFKSRLRKEFVRYGIIADILIESNEEISIKTNLLGHIVRTAVQEGKYI